MAGRLRSGSSPGCMCSRSLLTCLYIFSALRALLMGGMWIDAFLYISVLPTRFVSIVSLVSLVSVVSDVSVVSLHGRVHPKGRCSGVVHSRGDGLSSP